MHIQVLYFVTHQLNSACHLLLTISMFLLSLLCNLCRSSRLLPSEKGVNKNKQKYKREEKKLVQHEEECGCFSGALRETAWVCYCYYSCSLIDSLTTTLPLSLSRPPFHLFALLLLLFLLLPSPSTNAPSLPQKNVLLLPCALPVLIPASFRAED